MAEIPLAVICFLVSFGAIFLIIIGIVFCADETLDSTAGTIMLIVGSVVLLIHILLAVISHAIRAENREEEREEDVPQEKSEEPEPIVSHWDGEEK